MKLVAFVFKKVVKSFIGLLGNIIVIDSTWFSLNYHSFYYNKRFNDFGRKERKKYVKTTIIVDDKSQIVVSFSVHFGEIHDSKEFKKMLENMDSEVIGNFNIIIGDKGYDSERGKSRYCQKARPFSYNTGKKQGCTNISNKRGE